MKGMKTYKKIKISNKIINLKYKRDSEEITILAECGERGSYSYMSLGVKRPKIDTFIFGFHLAERRAVQKLAYAPDMIGILDIKGTYWEYDDELDKDLSKRPKKTRPL